jgi:hypothetical protein
MNQAPWDLETSAMDAGKYTFYAKIFKGDALVVSNLFTLIVGEQIPYNKAAASIPGNIQSGLFDQFEGGSGQGIAYMDFSPANLGNFRTNESADVSNDAQEGAILTWIDAGEWTEYTVNVLQDGLYDCALRYAAGNAGTAGKFSMWLDGKLLAENVSFPSTGKWETFGSVSIKNLPMTVGRRILKFSYDDGGMNVSNAQFTRISALPKTLPIAKAGGNISYPSTADSAICDGSKSTAGSLGYINYQWTQIYGPSKLQIKNPASSKATFKNLRKGVYKVRLTVNDSMNNDYNEVFIFVQDDGNVAPVINISIPISGATLIENQWVSIQASAEDLDGSVKRVTFFVNGDSVATDTSAPYEHRLQVSIGNYTAQAEATDNSGNSTRSKSISFSALSLAGNWVIEPVANSLAVGPNLANLYWWSNSIADVTTRSCLFDDVYQINKDGSFRNIMGTSTWLEGWQNAGKEGCGAPIAPFDGTLTGKWYVDSVNGQLVIDGKGLFLGLPKATNSGELASGSPVPNTRSYQIDLTANRLTSAINYGQGFWQFKMVRGNGTINTHTPVHGDWRLFPNPSSHLLYLQIPEEIFSYRIISQTGQIVMEGNETSINIKGLKQGLYNIQIETPSQVKTLRFIKEATE